jgi:hypothetical protein
LSGIAAFCGPLPETSDGVGYSHDVPEYRRQLVAEIDDFSGPTRPGAKNLQELIALLKANPGQHQYGTPGVGTPPHLEGEFIYNDHLQGRRSPRADPGAAPHVRGKVTFQIAMIHLCLVLFAQLAWLRSDS